MALYCAANLPKFLKIHDEYKKGNYERALQLAFIDFDGTLVQETIIEELKKLVAKCGDSETEDEDLAELCQESHMPIEQLIEKYKDASRVAGGGAASAVAKVVAAEASGSKPISPNLRGRRAQRLADAASNGEGSSGGSSSKESDAEVKAAEPVVEPATTPEESVTPATNGDAAAKSAAVSTQSDSKESDTSSANAKGTARPAAKLIDAKEKKVGADDDTSSEDEEDASYNEGNASDEDVLAADSDDDNEDDDDEDDDDENEDENEEESEEDNEYPDDEDDDGFLNSMIEAPGSSSGCTAVVALLVDRELFVANAGDSRCVVCRDGKALEMSLDHKPEDTEELERIKKAGGRVTLDGRVNGGLNLSRAIGDHGYKMNKELKPEEQMISAKPDIKRITIAPSDEFMVIACDGIWNFMSSEEVIEFVKVRLNDGREKLSTICEEVSVDDDFTLSIHMKRNVYFRIFYLNKYSIHLWLN